MSSAIHQPVRVRVTAAVLLTLILCLPWLTTLSERISPISYASEALGYRYFHSYRLLHGDKSPIWEAQGQTLERSPITTSPMTWALGSMYADGAIRGANPLKLRIMIGKLS